MITDETLEKAQRYIDNISIDYGDLNEKAEQQIKQAFIDGMKEASVKVNYPYFGTEHLKFNINDNNNL